MPCSSDHFVPILDEIAARPDPEVPRPSVVGRHPGWGGCRPGAGAPKGNLNALKHGRTSRRQAEILEAMARVPGVQRALIDLAKRERRRRKQAEEGFGILITRLLERTAAIVLSHQDNQGDNQGQYNQEFLAYLNETSAQIRAILEKPSRHRRTTIKGPTGAVQ